MIHSHPVFFVTFGADGETLITATRDNRVCVWKVPEPTAGEAKRLLLETEFETGMALDSGTPCLLDDAELARRCQQLTEAAPRRTEGDR
jgi:hypothetical protein